MTDATDALKDMPLAIPGLSPGVLYTSRLSARSALYTEFRLLLDGQEEALVSADYRALVVEGNRLARTSIAARKKLWKELHSRYRLNAVDPLFAAFWSEWRRAQSVAEQSLTAYVLWSLNGSTDLTVGTVNGTSCLCGGLGVSAPRPALRLV